MGRPATHPLSDINQELRSAICSKCGPVDIKIIKHSTGSLQFKCGNLNRENNRNWYRTNEIGYTPIRPCGTYQAWMRHYKKKETPCEPCAQAKVDYAQSYGKKYRSDNKKKERNRISEWQKENPQSRRARSARRRQRASVNLTPEQKQEALEYRRLISKDPCYYCGDLQEKMHVDHVIPLARGGLEIWHNLVNACPNCNLRKNTKLPEEFIRSL